MSRTNRTPRLYEEYTEDAFVGRHMRQLRNNSHGRHQYYFTKEGEAAYNAAVRHYEVEHARYLWGHIRYAEIPPYPLPLDYKAARFVACSIDEDKEAEALRDWYRRAGRDGWDGARHDQYRKYDTAQMRVKARKFIADVMRGEEEWEHLPYPEHTHGKAMQWD